MIEDENEWLSASEAKAMLARAYADDAMAWNAVRRRGIDGLLKAIATIEKRSVTDFPNWLSGDAIEKRKSTTVESEAADVLVSADFWVWCTAQDWVAGDFVHSADWHYRKTHWRVFGVRFATTDIRAICGDVVKGTARPLARSSSMEAAAPGNLAVLDAPLVERMHALIEAGDVGSAWAAAGMVAPAATGAPGNVQRRLAQRYRRRYRSSA